MIMLLFGIQKWKKPWRISCALGINTLSFLGLLSLSSCAHPQKSPSGAEIERGAALSPSEGNFISENGSEKIEFVRSARSKSADEYTFVSVHGWKARLKKDWGLYSLGQGISPKSAKKEWDFEATDASATGCSGGACMLIIMGCGHNSYYFKSKGVLADLRKIFEEETARNSSKSPGEVRPIVVNGVNGFLRRFVQASSGAKVEVVLATKKSIYSFRALEILPGGGSPQDVSELKRENEFYDFLKSVEIDPGVKNPCPRN